MVLAIICFGEFAREVYDVAQRINYVQQKWDSIIFVEKNYDGDERVVNESTFFETYNNEDVECVVAIGEVSIREKIYNLYKSKGYKFINLIDPLSSVSPSAVVNGGAIIFPFVYVAHDAYIGENTILHAHSIIENDCVVGCHSFISLGAFVGAGTKVGNVTFVGPNATIRDKIEIGSYSIIGMGSVVLATVDDEVVMVGNPARIIRKNVNKKIGLMGKKSMPIS